MHAYIHTYIHTYIHAYIHTYIHTYVHVSEEYQGLNWVRARIMKAALKQSPGARQLAALSPKRKSELTKPYKACLGFRVWV